MVDSAVKRACVVTPVVPQHVRDWGLSGSTDLEKCSFSTGSRYFPNIEAFHMPWNSSWDAVQVRIESSGGFNELHWVGPRGRARVS